MDKDNYMKETYAQIYNDNDPTPTLANKLKLLINELQPNLQINVVKQIPPSSSRNILHYSVKIHKFHNFVASACTTSNPDYFISEAKRLIINPPGRPMASGIGRLT